MRILAALMMLAGASALSLWIKRRHGENGPREGGADLDSGRALTTRGVETVAAMVAVVLILLAMFLVLRFIVVF